MKLKAIHLFLILLFALILCGFLGTCVREGLAMKNEKNKPIKSSDNGDSKTVTGPQGQPITATHKNTVEGIHQSEIPSGQEDFYILKSEIVPPVCPACPSISECPRQKPCPPCPPCARCPEPAFECKKVPNYITSDDRYLPRPVLSDFSQFGM